MSRHSKHDQHPNTAGINPFSVVADCASPGQQTRGVSSRQLRVPVKPPDTLDSGFVSSGLLSPDTPCAPLDQAKLRYPKEALCRPGEGGVGELTSELGTLSVEELGALSDEQRSAWEDRYIQVLHEAFRGDEDGDTHLHLAIIYRYQRISQCLIRLVPHADFLNLRNSYLQTPLHLAALTGQAELCRHLLVAGADLSRRDRHGNTALHLACERADRSCVYALTAPISAPESHQMSPKYSCPPAVPPPVDDWNYQGLSCLHLATLIGDLELVAHLVSHGASVLIGEGKSGRTPVHLAAETGNNVLLRFLVEACGATVDAETYGGLTGYQLALLNARLDVVETLEMLGAGRRELPESDQEMSDSDEAESFLKTEDLLTDVRIRGLPVRRSP